MSRPVFLEGENIFLSPLSAEDELGTYCEWVNDQETTVFMGSGKYPLTVADLKNYIMSFQGSRNGMLLGVFLKKELKHIGNVTLQQADHKDRRAEIGILLGDKKARGKGYATETLGILARHSFNKLNLNKLTAGIVKGNDASQKAFAKAGFKVEGTLREHFYLNGEYIDCIRMGLLRRESNDSAITHDQQGGVEG